MVRRLVLALLLLAVGGMVSADAAILELTWPLLDWLDVRVLRDGQVVEVWLTGDRRAIFCWPGPVWCRAFATPMGEASE